MRAPQAPLFTPVPACKTRHGLSETGVPPNSVIFGGTVPLNSVLFGGTVPPNSFPLHSINTYLRIHLWWHLKTNKRLQEEDIQTTRVEVEVGLGCCWVGVLKIVLVWSASAPVLETEYWRGAVGLWLISYYCRITSSTLHTRWDIIRLSLTSIFAHYHLGWINHLMYAMLW